MPTEWLFSRWRARSHHWPREGGKISCFAKKIVGFFLSFSFFVVVAVVGTLRLPVSITDQKEFLCCYDLFENFLVKREKVLFWKLEWTDQVSAYWFVTDIVWHLLFPISLVEVQWEIFSVN